MGKPKKSRGNGEGSIYSNGKYWVTAVTVGRDPATNRLKRKYFYSNTRKAAKEKLTEILYQLHKNSYVEPSAMLIGQWALYWFETFKKPQISSSTYSIYKIRVEKHIIKPFGHLALKSLTAFHIQEYYNKLSKNGTSSNYLKLLYTNLNTMCTQAVKMELLSKNPLENVVLPKSQKSAKKIKVLTVKQQQKLVEYCKKNEKDFIFIFLLATGLRIGEALALTWNDINFKKQTLYVKHTLIRVGNKYEVKEGAKTEYGERLVPFTQKIGSPLLEIKSKSKSDLVFPSKKNSYESIRNIQNRLKRICEYLDLPAFSPHALRHTFATRLIETGVNVKVISQLLGHADIKITLNIYAHALEDTLQANVSVLDTFL